MKMVDRDEFSSFLTNLEAYANRLKSEVGIINKAVDLIEFEEIGKNLLDCIIIMVY